MHCDCGAKKDDELPGLQVAWNTLFQAAEASAAPTATQPRASAKATRVVYRMMRSPQNVLPVGKA
jgi:hypothetical protein